MSSTYSPSLRIELIGSGDQAGAWSATTNSNLAFVLDTAIAGYQAVTVTSTAQALTYVNGPSSTANLNQSVYAMLKFNSASAATAIYAPPASKTYIIWNNSGYAITIYNSSVIGNTTAAGTGVAIANGDKVMVWSDGTNFYDTKSSSVTGTVAIANGGTGQTSANAAFNALAPAQTANRLLKSDGTNTSFAQAVLTTDVTGTLPLANGGTGVTTLAALGNLFYPVGSIYTNASVATNPGTLLGFGTWTAFGTGRMLISQDGTYPAGTTGGAATTTLSIGNLPSHSHSITDPTHTHTTTFSYVSNSATGPFDANASGTPNNIFKNTINSASTGITGTNATGSGTAVTTISPYIAVYMWQRTA
jgi:hypothetical protein